MVVLEFLSSESGLISFWLPLLMVFIAFCLTLLNIKRSNVSSSTLTIDQSIIEITNTYTQKVYIVRPASKKASSDSDGNVLFITIIICIILAVYYLKYRILIVNIATIISAMMFAFWSIQILNFYYSNYKKCVKWNIYMIVYFILNVLSFPLLHNLVKPVYIPFDTSIVENIVWENNVIAMVIQIVRLEASILPFILYQLLGSVLLFLIWIYMLLNVFYIRAIFSVSHGKSVIASWFVKKGYKWFNNYCNNILICLFGYLVVFCFVSGLIYKWLQ